MRRKQSAPDPNLVTLVIALFLIAVFLTLVYSAIAGPSPAISLMSLGAPPTPTPMTADAEGVVRDMYDAWTSGVETDYMNAIAPASREKIRLGSVASNFLDHGKLEATDYYELSLDFLTNVDYSDMSYSGQLVRSDYVTVTATGQIWIEALEAQFFICDIWDVRSYSGEWLVDVDAPERSARQQQIVAARLKDKPVLRDLPFGLGDLIDRAISGPEGGVKKTVNMCE